MIRRVTGRSMSPALKAGDIVIAWREPLRVGQAVIARQRGREVIKRITKLSDGKAYLTGDNSQESSDSRHFGPVPISAILGVVMIRLPRAVNPPAPRNGLARQLALGLAGVMVIMALLHLIRIDKLIPVIDVALPGGLQWALFFICTMVAAEVLALPFLLGLKLSPLARICGGLLVVLVPLAWTCLTIWTLGDYETTGQFSSYFNVPSNGLLLVVNVAWLLMSYWALYLLNYDKSFKQLSK